MRNKQVNLEVKTRNGKGGGNNKKNIEEIKIIQQKERNINLHEKRKWNKDNR